MKKVAGKALKISGPIGMTHEAVGRPELVPFDTLRVSVERFQVRNSSACSYVAGVMKEQESAGLTNQLIGRVQAGEMLDPPIIWQDGDGLRWVIDGHHRMEAMTEVGGPPKRKVWVQRFAGTTEAAARAFAFHIGRRVHLNMNQAESIDCYWRMLLCDEIVGSVRGRVKQYDISQSTVQRMDREKEAVVTRLQKEAGEAEVAFDASYIRVNAPAWKELAKWRESLGGKPVEDFDRRAIEGMLRTLTVRFTTQAKTQPDLLLEAFQEFYEEVTGEGIEIKRCLMDDDPLALSDGPMDF